MTRGLFILLAGMDPGGVAGFAGHFKGIGSGGSFIGALASFPGGSSWSQ